MTLVNPAADMKITVGPFVRIDYEVQLRRRVVGTQKVHP